MQNNPKTLEVRHVGVSIDRSPHEVYAFASQPENLARWAAGLGHTLTKESDEWIADGPLGKVRVRFTSENNLGVLDHDVTLETGHTVHNPIRVLPNGEGSEVIFTLFRQPGVSPQDFAEDARAVERDLRTLKSLMESMP